MFEKKVWKDRIAEYINRRTLTYDDGTTALVTVSRSEGTVAEQGDAFNAQTMNDLEQRIYSAFGVTLTGTLNAGETQIAFSDDSITSESLIDVYVNKDKVYPSEKVGTVGMLTLTFPAQSEDITVKVIVR